MARRGKRGIAFMAVWLVLWAAGILVALWLLGGALWRGELGAAPFLVIWLGFAALGLYAGVRRLQTLTGLAPPEGAPRRSPRNWKDGLTPEPFPPDPGPRAVDPQVPAAPTETRLPG